MLFLFIKSKSFHKTQTKLWSNADGHEFLILFATQTDEVYFHSKSLFSNLAVPESVFPVLGEEMIASPKNHLISFKDSMIILSLKVHFNPEKSNTTWLHIYSLENNTDFNTESNLWRKTFKLQNTTQASFKFLLTSPSPNSNLYFKTTQTINPSNVDSMYTIW